MSYNTRNVKHTNKRCMCSSPYIKQSEEKRLDTVRNNHTVQYSHQEKKHDIQHPGGQTGNMAKGPMVFSISTILTIYLDWFLYLEDCRFYLEGLGFVLPSVNRWNL